MNLFLKSIITRLLNQPTKSAITIISVSLAVMIISICINVNFKLDEVKNSRNGKQHITIMGGSEVEGSVDFDGETPFNDVILENIVGDFKGVTAINKFKQVDRTFSYNDELYRADSCLAVMPSFFTNFSIEILEGSNFVEGTDSKEVLISIETADLLFHDSSAVGQFIEHRSQIWSDNNERTVEFTPYEIIGVYKTPETFRKKQVGIPDVVYNYDSISVDEYIVLSVKSSNIDILKKRIERYLKSELGEERSFLIWEKHISDYWSDFDYIDEIVDMIIIFFYILAAVGLIVSSFSVFSMIMISVAERSRDIGLQRALGCKKTDVIKMFLLESLVIIFIGAIPGIILSLIFFPEVLSSTLPSITGGDIDLSKSISTNMELLPVLISIGVTMLAGSVFGIFPSLTAVSTMPIEAIKEN